MRGSRKKEKRSEQLLQQGFKL